MAPKHAWNLFHYLHGFGGHNSLVIHDTRDWTEAELHNIKHSHLYKLPTELLGVINEYLTPEDSFALALTCPRFYYSCILAEAQRDLKSTKIGHFITLCMAEGLGELKEEYCCRGCLSTHPASNFSMDELKKRHYERNCLKKKKSLKIDHNDFTHAELAELRDEFISNIPGIYKNKFLRMLFSSPKITIMAGVNIFNIDPNKKVSKADFEAICRKLDYPVCKHLTTSHKGITDLFVPEYFEKKIHTLEEKEKLPDYERSYKCKKCKTFVVITKSSDWNTCLIVFFRPVGRLLFPLESEWLSQASSDEGPFTSKDGMRERGQWLRDYWSADESSRSELGCPRLDGNSLFTPIVLHKSAWMARLGVRTWSFLCSCIPFEFCQRYPGTINLYPHDIRDRGEIEWRSVN